MSIEDVRDAREETAVHELRQKLVERGSLPPRHDDYHTLLRYFINSKWHNQISSDLFLAHTCSVALYFLVGFLKPGTLTLRRRFRCGKKCLRGERNMELIPSLRYKDNNICHSPQNVSVYQSTIHNPLVYLILWILKWICLFYNLNKLDTEPFMSLHLTA